MFLDKIRNAKTKVSNGLAVSSWLLALVAGFAASATFLADWVDKILGIAPDSWWFFPIAVGTVGFCFVLGDLLEEGIPDKLSTIYITILWPSTWVSIDGGIGRFLNGWIGDMNGYLDKHFRDLVTDDPMAKGTFFTGVFVIFATFSLFWAHKYARKNKTTADTTSTTSSTPLRAGGRRRGTRG
jgi:hypothetical protein